VPKERRDEDRVFHIGGVAGGRGGSHEPPVEGPQPTLRPVISPSSVGATLAITREKFGQELKQVAQTLRIRLAYLEAIEDDRYGDLPGLTYAVGFVRSYADYLGLDSKLLVERYKDEAQGLNRKTQLHFPTPAGEAKVPTGAIILVALILIGLTYVGWSYFSDDTQGPAVAVAPASPGPASPGPAAPASGTPAVAGSGTADTGAAATGTAATGTAATGTATGTGATPPAPAPTEPESPAATGTQSAPDATAAVASEAPAESQAAAGTAAQAATGDAAQAATAGAPAPSGESSGQSSGQAAGAGTASAAPAAPPAPAAPEAAAGAAAPGTQTAMAPPLPAALELAHQPRLIIKAEQDSWVQIRDAKDQAILTQVLRQGDSYVVPEQPGLVLLTGNAGGIVLVVDGKPLPVLGPVGAVRRNIALDPDALAPQ